MSKSKQQLVEKITDALDKSSELDKHDLDKLAQARQQALAAIPQNNRRATRNKTMYWLGGAVAAGLTAIVLWVVPPINQRVPAPELAELEWLLESEDLHMLEDELQFYDWVESQVEAG